MRNIKLTLEYDGTEFCGSQKQAGERTVQEELNTALRKLFQKPVQTIFAGRTDSGAHAEGQVANFKVASKLPLYKIERGINHYLPEDVRAVQAVEVPLSFHAQFDAKWKTYEYCVVHSKIMSPLRRRHAYFYGYDLNLSEMKKAARLLTGRHDFRAFESSGSRRKTAVRTIRKLTVKETGTSIVFTIESNGFLYKMVRNLVGALLSVGAGKIKIPDLKKALASKESKPVYMTVPATGLTLKNIIY